MELWCSENNMEVNKTKSGILPILLPRGRHKLKDKFNGYPVVKHYTYLGIKVSQTIQAKAAILERKRRAKKTAQ